MTGAEATQSKLLETALADHRAGRLEAAEAAYRAFLDRHPGHADASHLLGVLLREKGDCRAAAALIRDAIAGCPDIAGYHVSLGATLRRAGDRDGAVAALTRALAIDGENIEALNTLGLTLAEAGDLDAAAARFGAALALCPDRIELRFNLANALLRAHAHDRAAAEFRAVLALAPDHADALSGLATACRARGDPDTAAALYHRALAVRPADPKLHSNLGVALQQLGDLDGAQRHFDAAITLAPELAEAQKNRAMLLLLRGDFAAGFDAFEWRWRSEENPMPKRPFAQPAWDGSPLGGKTILAWGEQGIGDEIMLGSLLPEVIAAAAHCVIECAPRLARLFARSFPDAELVARADPPHPRTRDADIDLQCATGSLCRRLRRDRAAFASPKAYLRADPARVTACRARYDQRAPGLKVGIAWRSATPVWGAVKSAPLELWGPLLSQPALFVNLQYGDCRAELAAARARRGVEILTDSRIDQLADLDAFAAQVAAMDLVVTTSSTTAHMAGALGVPTWVLLAHSPDWRWQFTGGSALWYPDCRLFRQPCPGDWATPLRAAADELGAIARQPGLGGRRPARRLLTSP